MPADPRKIALYMQGTFDKPNPNRQEMDTMLSVAKDICGSGFGTVILGQWHARSDGGIYYNDTSLDEVLQTLKVIPAALKDGGSVRKVLITFGPFGTDFQYIKDHLELHEHHRQLAQEHGYRRPRLGHRGRLRSESRSSSRSDAVGHRSWYDGDGRALHLQYFLDRYPAEDEPGRLSGLRVVESAALRGRVLPRLGGRSQGPCCQPGGFLAPGYSVTQGVPHVETPSYVENHLRQLRSSHPSVDGAFIWRYEDMEPEGYSPAQYAAAITRGLGGTSGDDAVSQQAQ